jgi:hypothetical protein
LSTRSIVPRKNDEGSIGTAEKNWGEGYFKQLYADSFSGATSWGNLDSGFSDSTYGAVTPIDCGASI